MKVEMRGSWLWSLRVCGVILAFVGCITVYRSQAVLSQSNKLSGAPERSSGASRIVTRNFLRGNIHFGVKPGPHVPTDDLLHMHALHGACMKFNQSIVTWKYGINDSYEMDHSVIDRNASDLVERLRECPDVDIFHPAEHRGFGYCEDGVAYTKYLKSRLLPEWVFKQAFYDEQTKRNVSYFELCPRTPLLFFNHYWFGIPDLPSFPSEKPIYMMPNIEMYELNERHINRTDVVICKTADCYDRVSKYLSQRPDLAPTQVLYTRHTSLDMSAIVKHQLGEDSLQPQDFSNVSFLHVAGGSTWKGTHEILDCWMSRSDLPPLELHIHEWLYEFFVKRHYGSRLAKAGVKLETRKLSQLDFGKKVAETAFFLCPSKMEGYGHYINEARAVGGLIVSTDAAPMNELVTPEIGVLVESKHSVDSNQLLGGGYRKGGGLKNAQGLVARFSGRDVCEAVDFLVRQTRLDQRIAMAKGARERYHEDSLFFIAQMSKLIEFAKRGGAANGLTL